MAEMVDIDAEVRKLRESRLMQHDEQCLVFEEAVAAIMSAERVEHIPLLCQGFDDDTEHHEVMFGLIHAIEEYDKIATPSEATKYFVRSIPVMLPHATEWAEQMITRFLNKKSNRQLLRKILQETESENRIIAVRMLQNIASNDADYFGQKVAEVIA